MQKRLILIRHGESEGNLDHQVYVDMPDYKVDLTDKGQKQAYSAGEQLRPLLANLYANDVQIIFSPYFRAKQTHDIAMMAGDLSLFNSYEEPLFREQEYVQDPKSVAQVGIEIERSKEKDQFWHRFTGGESYADVDQRITTALNMDNHPGTTVIFAHGNVIKAIVRRILKIPTMSMQDLETPDNCERVVIDDMKNINIYLTTATKLVESISKLREN